MRVVGRIFATVIATCTLISTARAISFDKLSNSQQASATLITPSAGAGINANGTLGGKRWLSAKLDQGFQVSAFIGGGVLSHSQDASTLGSTLIAYDGVALANITTSGLGGLNLTEDGASAMRVGIIYYDFPNNQPITLEFTVFDATDPTKRSVGLITLSSPVSASINNPVFKDALFSDFIAVPGFQPVNFKNVGAISLLINGTQSPAHDLQLTFIGTNGRCNHIPTNKLVLDQCGVCNGDNSTCSDCEGTPNGTKIAGTSCSTGSFGICSIGTYSGQFPTCQCNQTNQPSTEICDGLDNNCNALVDEGFSLGESCSVGVGACMRTGTKICAATGSTCSVTPGAPSGEICDALDNDCDGLIDEGSPTTGPKVDQCGVCGGDGTSCLSCETVNVFTTLAALDGGAKQQEAVVNRATAILLSQPNGAKFRSYVKQVNAKAHTLQLANWILSWTIPSVITSCKDVTPVCVTTSNLPKLVEYRSRNDELRDLAFEVLNKIKAKKGTKAFTRAKSTRTWAEVVHLTNLNESFTVPETNYACSTN